MQRIEKKLEVQSKRVVFFAFCEHRLFLKHTVLYLRLLKGLIELPKTALSRS